MGVTQPYLYESTPKYNEHDPFNGFDPKAFTRASRAPPPRAKPKQEGPLINFNRHPDSYLVLPYGNTDAKKMNPRTKAAIKWVRWTQLLLRQLQLVAAVGLLVCAICIRGTAETEGWIIRIPPGADIAVTTYAIYHLFRPAKGRTPASSASYHFFALVTDAGFIPFYVFTAIMANYNRIEDTGSEGRWGTTFNNNDATMKVLTATWLTAMTIGGMHLVSFCLDIWLVIVFRKISHLPPDMNPLEDNLTSRTATKHKYKNSDATVSTISEKRLSHLSSNVSIPGPFQASQSHDPLMPESVPVPFIHTRNNSTPKFSPHTPESARQSRIDVEKRAKFYQQPSLARSSHANVYQQDDSQSQRNSTMDSSSKYSAYSDVSRDTLPSVINSKRRKSLASTSGNIQRGSKRAGKRETEKRNKDLQSDNWFVHMETPIDNGYEPMQQEAYYDKPRDTRRDSLDLSDDEGFATHADVPAPLRMNPPTPPHGYRPQPSLSTISDVSSISRASTPKSKFYGSLRSATQNLRPVNGTTRSPSGRSKYSVSPEPEMQQVKRQHEESPRVVSRTGLDVDGDLGLGAGTMMGAWRRREVSGKMVEEGRSPGLYR